MVGLQAGEDLQTDVRALHERTTALAQNVRHLSHDLHPTVLRHAGLAAALASYCGEVERSHTTALSCSAEGDIASIAPEPALCLYRIAQEALRNVVAHAGARRADVRLLRRGEHAELTITDDGRGFDVAGTLKRGKGLGLVSITERVRLAGGTVRITAHPGKGACVRVRIPASAPARSEYSVP
jgi:two-component system sensor histidine kinase UhpB